MKIEHIEADSRVFGRNVLSIEDFDSARDFSLFERQYVNEFHPVYVSCKIPLERVADAHVLERHGFSLIECQIRSFVRLRKPFDVSSYKYDFSQVTREEDLEDVLEIAASTFTHDRLKMDPELPPELSGRRYREYVMASFRAPNEAVYRLVDQATRRVVAFKTHRYQNDTEVLFLLGGVHPELKNVGIGLINEYFEFNELIRKGIKRGITHISACNYPVFNLEIADLGFRVLQVFAVLRKLYP